MRRIRIKTKSTLATVAMAAALFLGHSATAQDEATELAQKTQNPISDLINVPIMNNTGFNAGPGNDVENTLNIMAVYPQSISRNWNWILGGYYNVEKPDQAAEWTLRVQVQLLFPNK